MKAPITVFLLLLNFLLHGQVFLERQVIASTGTDMNYATGMVSFSVGEVVIETAIGAQLLLNQGFHQTNPKEDVINNVAVKRNKIDYRIYPNPANDWLNIDLAIAESTTVLIEIYSSDGKRMSAAVSAIVPHHPILWNIADLPTGSYLLVITNSQKMVSMTKKFSVIR